MSTAHHYHPHAPEASGLMTPAEQKRLLYSPMPLVWIKTERYRWSRLNRIQTDDHHFDGLSGVFIVWHGGPTPAVLCLGSGVIRERLSEAQADPRVQAYADRGLYATWARVAPRYRDGVLAFLLQEYEPLLAAPSFKADPIPVELP